MLDKSLRHSKSVFSLVKWGEGLFKKMSNKHYKMWVINICYCCPRVKMCLLREVTQEISSLNCRSQLITSQLTFKNSTCKTYQLELPWQWSLLQKLFSSVNRPLNKTLECSFQTKPEESQSSQVASPSLGRYALGLIINHEGMTGTTAVLSLHSFGGHLVLCP